MVKEQRVFLTEIQCLEIEHVTFSHIVNISLCMNSLDEHISFTGLQKIFGLFTHFLTLSLKEFLQSKAMQRLSLFSKITWITAVAAKKTKRCLYIVVLCSNS